ncbi:unnamed protein product [Trichobilharzia regenti]|nr:unnamed protein product [Trichobilharzia regenti]
MVDGIIQNEENEVCIVSDSVGKEDHEKSDLAWKSSSNSIDDHIWEEFYEFNKAYMECLITYLNEVKCIVTIHTEANASSLLASSSSSSAAAAAVTNDNTCAKTSQSFDYPTVHLLESSEINLLDNNWQQNQLIHIDKEREILQVSSHMCLFFVSFIASCIEFLYLSHYE